MCCLELLVRYGRACGGCFDIRWLWEQMSMQGIVHVVEGLQYSLSEEVSKKAMGLLDECHEMK